MEPVNSCYTRLEQRIRNTYSTIASVGGSVLGRMSLSFAAELIGSLAGHYAATQVTTQVTAVSSHYPVLARTLVASGGVIVLRDVVQRRLNRMGMTEPRAELITALMGAICLPAAWELGGEQAFPYLLSMNQMAGRILGGYVGLLLTGVVPVLWDQADWRRSYATRMLRYEGMGVVLGTVIAAPQERIACAIFFVPRFLFCTGMQGIAFQADRLVPFSQQCVRNIRMAKQQMLPLLIHLAIQDYVDIKRQVVVEKMTQSFYDGLKKILSLLFPLITDVSKELPKLLPKVFPKVLPKIVPRVYKKKVEELVKGGIRQGVRVGVHEGRDFIEENSDPIVHWGLRTISLFGRLLDESVIIKGKTIVMKELHETWKDAFLDGRYNDREIARLELVNVLNQAMEQHYGQRYSAIHKVIHKLCKSKNLTESLVDAMKQLPAIEKELLGVPLTHELHFSYWQGVYKIYLPHFLTVGVLHYGELTGVMMPSEQKELMIHLESMVCHTYVDVVLPRLMRPGIRKVIRCTMSGISGVQDMVVNVVRGPEQQTWVAPSVEKDGMLVEHDHFGANTPREEDQDLDQDSFISQQQIEYVEGDKNKQRGDTGSLLLKREEEDHFGPMEYKAAGCTEPSNEHEDGYEILSEAYLKNVS